MQVAFGRGVSQFFKFIRTLRLPNLVLSLIWAKLSMLTTGWVIHFTLFWQNQIHFRNFTQSKIKDYLLLTLNTYVIMRRELIHLDIIINELQFMRYCNTKRKMICIKINILRVFLQERISTHHLLYHSSQISSVDICSLYT